MHSHDDFTPEQLAGLKGDAGDTEPAGPKGEQVIRENW